MTTAKDRHWPDDHKWMRQAIALAEYGQGWVEPNPMVGCVLVARDGREIGSGFHARFGEAHAERAALAEAERRGETAAVSGGTAYVTLEPCCHHGKTPPCTEALLASGLERVVVAMLDPFPQVQGKGCAQLREHGISVELGVEEGAARALNAPYLKKVHKNLPWIIAKWAMSLDGKMATTGGHSQWISGPESREFVHQLRARMDAIMVGSETALVDDPLLTARTDPVKRKALRVVTDTQLRIPLTSQLVNTASEFPVLLLAGHEAPPKKLSQLQSRGVEIYVSTQKEPAQRMREFLRFLTREKSVTNLLVEGGAKLLGSLADLRLIDQCEVFLAPKIIGGREAPSPVGGVGAARVEQGTTFRLRSCTQRGSDLHGSYVVPDDN